MAILAIPQSFAAWIAAAITALNINLQAINAPLADLGNYLVDPLNVIYTYPEEQIDSYLNRSVIQITPGATIIDGVSYDDIWLSHDAADIFRTNAFDFQTGNAIASESTGSFASGSGYVVSSLTSDRVPLFSVPDSSYYQSTLFTLGDGQLGRYDFPVFYSILSLNTANQVTAAAYDLDDSLLYLNRNYSSRPVEPQYQIYANTNSVKLRVRMRPSFGWSTTDRVIPSCSFLPSEFSFDYVSGLVPASDLPLGTDDGLLIHLPSSHSGSSLSQFLSDYPDFGQPGGVLIDPDIDPDIYSKLDNIATIIAPLINILKSEYAPIPVVPDPPYSGPISDAPWSGLSDILKSIQQSISSIPDSISRLGDRILQDIQEGPIRLFDKALDIIRTAFAPVFSLITSGLGIWHYVVEWFSSISSPFSFILSVLPSGVLVPVYASVAGFLVIAIFRRFGR